MPSFSSAEQLTQDLAVLRRRFTGQTAPYDRTLRQLSDMSPDSIAPYDISCRLLVLAMAADRPVIESLKAKVCAAHDRDVQFFGATAGYLRKIAEVLYADQ